MKYPNQTSYAREKPNISKQVRGIKELTLKAHNASQYQIRFLYTAAITLD